MRRIEINANDEGQRLDKFVQKTVWGMPLSLVYKYIRLKRIKVNRRRAECSYRLVRGDVVEMYIPEEFSKKETDPAEFLNVQTELQIAYEDENIIICDKPVGMLVHTGDAGENDSDSAAERETLLFRIKAYLVQRGEYDPEAENSFAPALCNRIDRNTGGLVIAAKNASSLRAMNEEIKNGGVIKKYLCAAHGRFEKSSGVLKAFLLKDSVTKTVGVYDKYRRGTKEIITEYRVLDYNKKLDLSLLEIILHTGRTHQIRAHLAHEGHCLLGDGKYGDNKEDRRAGWDRQALYSYQIAFKPTTERFGYLSGKTVGAQYGGIRFLELFSKGCLES